MSAIRRFFLRLYTMLRSREAERDLAREIASHLTLLEDEYRRRGMSKEHARLAAQRAFGGLDQAKELHRDARSFRWLDDARRDAFYALRTLRRDRGFAAVTLLTLAIGIGATTTIFSGVNAVLLRPLPFPEPHRLVLVFEQLRDRRAGATAPDFLEWHRSAQSFDGLAAYASTTMTLTGAGDAERIPARRVSADYFRVLRVQPTLGRGFTAADDAHGAPRTVLVSDALWRSRFNGDVTMLGRVLVLDGEPHTVIGVLPPSINLSERAEQFYVPLAITPAERASTGARFLNVIGRLQSGVSVEQAQSEMVKIAAHIATLRPHSNTDVSAKLEDVHTILVGDLRRPLYFFMVAVVFLLLIACANVANLQLVRATARQHEVAIRAALGAGYSRIVRQFVIESVVIATLGGAIGSWLTTSASTLIAWLVPAAASRLTGQIVDWRVLAFTFGISIATGVLFGLAPAWQMSRRAVRDRLSDHARTSTGGERHRLAGVFAVTQVALALLLLVGAGLSLRSFMRVQSVDPGFQSAGVLSFRTSLPATRYAGESRELTFYSTLLEQIRALPGVTAAAASSSLPLRGSGFNLSAPIDGRPKAARPIDVPMFFYRGVTPEYFASLGIPLIQGRRLEATDREGAPRVGVINQTAARQYWPDENPIGARITPDDAGSPLEIVGVVADTKHFGLTAEVQPELFVSVAQAPETFWRWTQRTMDVIVRTSLEPTGVAGPIRDLIRRLDPDLPVYQLMTLDSVIAESIATRQHAMLLTLVCGLVALMLAALGIYGVIAFIVAGHTQEIGVRMALGAARRDILTMVLGRTVRLCLVGLVIGVGAALGLGRLIESFLYEVKPTDAATYASVCGLVLTVALAAALLPARRAIRVDPVTALRAN